MSTPSNITFLLKLKHITKTTAVITSLPGITYKRVTNSWKTKMKPFTLPC